MYKTTPTQSLQRGSAGCLQTSVAFVVTKSLLRSEILMQVLYSEMSPHTVRQIRTDISAELEAFVNRHSYSLIMDVAGFSETPVPICRSMASHLTSSYFRNMFLYIFSTSEL